MLMYECVLDTYVRKYVCTVRISDLVSTPMAFIKRKLSSTLEHISRYLLPAGRFSTKSKFQACKREMSAYLI